MCFLHLCKYFIHRDIDSLSAVLCVVPSKDKGLPRRQAFIFVYLPVWIGHFFLFY